jgi:hypothetical protein
MSCPLLLDAVADGEAGLEVTAPGPCSAVPEAAAMVNFLAPLFHAVTWPTAWLALRAVITVL